MVRRVRTIRQYEQQGRSWKMDQAEKEPRRRLPGAIADYEQLLVSELVSLAEPTNSNSGGVPEMGSFGSQ